MELITAPGLILTLASTCSAPKMNQTMPADVGAGRVSWFDFSAVAVERPGPLAR